MSELIGVSLQMPTDPVEPGRSLQATLIIQNRGDVVDQLGIQVGGVPPDWVELGQRVVPLFPGDQTQVQVSFQPPRTADAVSGSHQITIWVQSKEHQGQYTVVKDTLHVNEFYRTSMDVTPKRASTRQASDFRLRLTNEGNAPAGFQFQAQDDEQGLDYKFARPSVTLNPGQSAEISVTVEPKEKKRFGASKQHNFRVNAVPVGGVGEGSQVGGQFIQLTLIPTWVIPIVGMVAIALCVGAILLLLQVIGRPPEVTNFSAISASSGASQAITVEQGEVVTFQWQVDRGSEVSISPPVSGELTVPSGVVSFVPETDQVYVLTVTGRGGQTDTSEVSITIAQQPPPTIVSFTGGSGGGEAGVAIDVIEGESVTLNWEVSNADRIVIDPPVDGDLTNPQGSAIAIPVGNMAYTLQAINDGGTEEAKVQITIQGLPPTIDTFSADPAVLVRGQEDEITLSWVAPGAESVTVEGVGQFSGAVGTTNVPAPENSRSFTLIATNTSGLVEKTVDVTVSEINCTSQADGLNVRRGPGAGPSPIPDFPLLGIPPLNSGDHVQPLSRYQLDNGSIWLEVFTEAGQKGWILYQDQVGTQYVACSNLDLLDLPEGTSPPTLTPTPSSTPTPTPTITPTPSITPTPFLMIITLRPFPVTLHIIQPTP